MTVIASSLTSRDRTSGLPVYLLIALVGSVLWFVSREYPADMPFWGPYDFSWAIWLAITLPGFWYCRGLARLPRAAWPPAWRRACFALGVLLIYVLVQTQFEFLAQRMFFTNRLQHVGMHHIGPLLLGLSMAGPVIVEGGPDVLRRIVTSPPVLAAMWVIQQPVIAVVLFVGLFYFWLIPSVHFVAMLDPFLYQVMNWTMVVDGILFWALVLDTRPAGKARTGFGVRAVLSMVVMFPQIVLGALITFAQTDLFPYYAFCGRYFQSVSPVADQQIGGIIIWIPPAMMSIVGLIAVLSNMRRAGR